MAQALFPRALLRSESAGDVHHAADALRDQILSAAAEKVAEQNSYIFLWTTDFPEERFSPRVRRTVNLYPRRRCSIARESQTARGLLCKIGRASCRERV